MTVSTDERHDGDAGADHDGSGSASAADSRVDENGPIDAATSPEKPASDGGDAPDPTGSSAVTVADAVDDSLPHLRPFDSTDRDALLSLCETVTGEPMDSTRFDGLFLDAPFALDETPIHVAERDGELVGAHLSVPVRMRVGTDVVTGLCAYDTVVRPDYRETDLAARLASAATDRYDDSEATFGFAFLDDDALDDVSELDYRVADELPTYYRMQSSGAFAGGDGVVTRALGRLAAVAARGYTAAKRRRVAVDRTVTVSRVDGVAADRLASLADRTDVGGIHAVRDAAFYRRRFADGETAYRTYFASRDGETVAAVVVADRDGSRVELVDALPSASLADDAENPADETADARDDAAIRTLLVAVTEQYADADCLAAFGSAFPERAMRAVGFVRDDDYPLSLRTTPTTLVTRPYCDGDVSNADSWRCGGEILTDGTVWRPTLADRFS
ncbi:GNAT family N-acetyltransferase [Haloprofundus salinisoli]|uniref:GNAT family N-acetyltransferase n=1 Tax=Haloprofundus salinisoli TaxID=2876193 RepID=UPI001CCBD4F6|nr:GNAT family N-acetyltransferase [Haloprofundus salinisoli]